jgi:hypothetical protein
MILNIAFGIVIAYIILKIIKIAIYLLLGFFD